MVSHVITSLNNGFNLLATQHRYWCKQGHILHIVYLLVAIIPIVPFQLDWDNIGKNVSKKTDAVLCGERMLPHKKDESQFMHINHVTTMADHKFSVPQQVYIPINLCH